MRNIIWTILVLFIITTSLSSAHLNRGVPLDNEITRIINGEAAEDGQFPYQVRVLMYAATNCTFGRFVCGGSIIAKNWILTAGHCAIAGEESVKFLGWQIQAGEILINEPRQRRIVLLADAFPHPDYDPKTLENDIGLLRTYVPFDFTTPYVKPIHLVAANTDKASHVGELVTASGFGLITNDGPLATQLFYTNLTVIDFYECDENYFTRDNFHIPSTSFCALNDIDKSATCGGDSGGPITIIKDGTLTQIGLVSFGSDVVGCNEAPDGYTDVAVFIPWIHEVIHGQYKN